MSSFQTWSCQCHQICSSSTQNYCACAKRASPIITECLYYLYSGSSETVQTLLKGSHLFHNLAVNWRRSHPSHSQLHPLAKLGCLRSCDWSLYLHHAHRFHYLRYLRHLPLGGSMHDKYGAVTAQGFLISARVYITA